MARYPWDFPKSSFLDEENDPNSAYFSPRSKEEEFWGDKEPWLQGPGQDSVAMMDAPPENPNVEAPEMYGPPAPTPSPSPSPSPSRSPNPAPSTPQAAKPIAPAAVNLPQNLRDQLDAIKGSIMDPNAVAAPRGSGRTQDLEGKGNIDSKLMDITNKLYDPTQIKSGVESWANLPVFQNEQKSIDDQKAQLGMMAGMKPQLDLSPLARLVDSWYGTKLAQGYTKPQTPQEKANTLFTYGNKLSQDQRDMTGNIIKAFGDSRAGLTNTMSQLLFQEQMRNMQQDPNIRHFNNYGPQNFKGYTEFATKQMGDLDKSAELKNLIDQVGSNNNPAALQDLGIRITKYLTNTARQNAQELQATGGGDPAILNRIAQTANKYAGNKDEYLTPTNKSEYLDLLYSLGEEANKVRAIKSLWLKSPKMLSRWGLDPGAGDAAIPPSLINVYPSRPSQPTGAPAAGAAYDPNAVAAEMARRAAAKAGAH